jgi:hypothetical protein
MKKVITIQKNKIEDDFLLIELKSQEKKKSCLFWYDFCCSRTSWSSSLYDAGTNNPVLFLDTQTSFDAAVACEANSTLLTVSAVESQATITVPKRFSKGSQVTLFTLFYNSVSTNSLVCSWASAWRDCWSGRRTTGLGRGWSRWRVGLRSIWRWTDRGIRRNANDIAVAEVIANYKNSARTTETTNRGTSLNTTTESGCSCSNNLSVVAADLSALTSVGECIIELSFGCPRVYGTSDSSIDGDTASTNHIDVLSDV